jgi:ribonucleotide reductase beta subunit family protein with ferritin-like domain
MKNIKEWAFDILNTVSKIEKSYSTFVTKGSLIGLKYLELMGILF